MTTLILVLIGLLLAAAAGVAGRALRLLRPARRRTAQAAMQAAALAMARSAHGLRAFSQLTASGDLFDLRARIWTQPRQRLAEPD